MVISPGLKVKREAVMLMVLAGRGGRGSALTAKTVKDMAAMRTVLRFM
jgi:hypothetical protein